MLCFGVWALVLACHRGFSSLWTFWRATEKHWRSSLWFGSWTIWERSLFLLESSRCFLLCGLLCNRCLFVHNSLLDMSFKCQFCGKEGALRCSKCKRVYYCSKQCQVRDWPMHKSVCGKYLKDYTDAVAVFIFWCTQFLENERFLSSIDVFWRKCCRFGIVTNIGINHYCVCSHSFWLQKELSPYQYEINVNQYSHWW